MITLKIIDKNGKELCDGDTIRYIGIKTYYEEVNEFYGFYYDAQFEWRTMKIEAQKMYDEENHLYIPCAYYDRDEIINYFSISRKNFEEEIKEVFHSLEKDLGIIVNSEAELEYLMWGFEII